MWAATSLHSCADVHVVADDSNRVHVLSWKSGRDAASSSRSYRILLSHSV